MKNHLFVDPNSSLWKFVEGIVQSEGLELYDLQRPSPDLLRVFVHRQSEKLHAASENVLGSGASIDDCTTITKRLRHVLAVEGDELGVGSEPRLEVSSPGVERSLRLPEHFKSAGGLKVKIVDATGSHIGVLDKKTSDLEVSFCASDETSNAQSFAFTDIQRAHVVYEQ